MARVVRRALVGSSFLAAGLVLASCGVGGAVADAKVSCGFVHKALALESQSEASNLSKAQMLNLQAKAMSELLKGSQSAAMATSIDGSWNALQTTISEAERVPIVNLEPALKRICKVADASSPYL